MPGWLVVAQCHLDRRHKRNPTALMATMPKTALRASDRTLTQTVVAPNWKNAAAIAATARTVQNMVDSF